MGKFIVEKKIQIMYIHIEQAVLHVSTVHPKMKGLLIYCVQRVIRMAMKLMSVLWVAVVTT